MIAINIQYGKPKDYTESVISKLKEIQTCIDHAKENVKKECPYDLECDLYQLKRILHEATEMVNQTADYYEVASTVKPNKEDVVLTKPLEPRK